MGKTNTYIEKDFVNCLLSRYPAIVELAELIRKLREHSGMTQRELATKIGCDHQTVHRWEAGLHKPRGKDVERLAKIFGIESGLLRNPKDWQDLGEIESDRKQGEGMEDPRERFLVDTFRLLDEPDKADLVAHASRLLGHSKSATA